MILKIALFELRKKLRQLSTYIYFAIFFAIAALVVMSAGGVFQQDGVAVGSSGGRVKVNSPVSLFAFISGLHHFGVIITAAVMGQAVYQDFHHQTFTMFFTSPIHKLQYLIGRFFGSFLTLLLIFSSIGIGFFLASLFPLIDQKLIGPNQLQSYLRPYAFTVIPNLLFTGAIFFGLAALTRKILPVYTSGVVLLIGYLIANAMSRNLDQKNVAGLLDPFGMRAFSLVTEYWTPAEQNSLQVPLTGMLLWNRLLWLSIAFVVFSLTAWRFKSNYGGELKSRWKIQKAEMPLNQRLFVPKTEHRDFRSLYRLPGLTWLNFKETVKNVYFAVIVLAGVLFLILTSQTMSGRDGMGTYPVTALVAELSGGQFSLFILIIITFYSGELVWRERDTNIHQLMDVLPSPDWLPLAAKTLALILIQVLLAAVVMICGMCLQAFQGYFRFEPMVYITQLFGLNLVEYALLCVLAIAVQSLTVNKYVGHFVMVLYYLAVTFVGQFGLEHNLYRYGKSPGVTYSDMNGYGHFLLGIAWFDCYWALWAILMVLAANLFWVRGTETYFPTRWKLAKQRFTKTVAFTSSITILGIGLVGGWIYYSTTILNEFRTSKSNTRNLAEYERKYKHLQDIAQPRITDVKISFELFPSERRLLSSGTMKLVNKTQEAIAKIYVQFPRLIDYSKLEIDGLKAESIDKEHGIQTFKLSQKLQPGQEAILEFDLKVQPTGFMNEADRSSIVVYNGTFFNNAILPRLGYDANRELSSESDRRRMKLGERERMAEVNDMKARANNYISNDADWISLESTVSTSTDQIAIVPGYLQKEWTENGRRFFHYKTDGKIPNFYSVLSAKYEVRRDQWRGKVSFGKSDDSKGEMSPDVDLQFAGSDQDVSIEIYYQKGHEFNIDAMVQAIKDSLEYYTVQFGPYQHRQVRIVEFPRYADFAQAFPNTIPYSESVGFVVRVNPNDPNDIDYPYYVTAHEIAHQWWGHQVIGGNVKGATLMSETLSQYSSLMVMKRKLGADQMRRFLRYELDSYLRGRFSEKKKELPLAFNENQAYIHYNKGSLVMYALQDYIGEENVNRALAKYIRLVGYQDPPYTNSLELVDLLREETPDDMKYLIEDLFETITLFDNRALSATYREKDGQYDVSIEVTVKKLRADQEGADQEIDANDWIDIGIVDSKNKPVLVERKKLVSGKNVFTMTVDQKPAKAGIDPLNKLIDRRPSDNLVPATSER